MPERRLWNQEQAYVQRLERLERRVEQLNSRAWPGAVRYIQQDQPLAESFFEPATILTLDITPGKWAIFGSVTATIDTDQGVAIANMQINGTRTDTGEQFLGFNPPLNTPAQSTGQSSIGPPPGFQRYTWPLNAFVVAEAPARTTLELQVSAFIGTLNQQWTHGTLLAIPV